MRRGFKLLSILQKYIVAAFANVSARDFACRHSECMARQHVLQSKLDPFVCISCVCQGPFYASHLSVQLHHHGESLCRCYTMLCSDRLNIDPKEHPILFAEPTINTKALREQMVQTAFEQYGCPAIFLAKNAVLSSFATGRQTSLVVDAGHEGTVGKHPPCHDDTLHCDMLTWGPACTWGQVQQLNLTCNCTP